MQYRPSLTLELLVETEKFNIWEGKIATAEALVSAMLSLITVDEMSRYPLIEHVFRLVIMINPDVCVFVLPVLRSFKRSDKQHVIFDEDDLESYVPEWAEQYTEVITSAVSFLFQADPYLFPRFGCIVRLASRQNDDW